MKRRRVIPAWTVALFVGIALVGLVAIFLPGEPTYQGRSLSSWLTDLTVTGWPEPPEKTAAREAVRQIGTNAIPYLLDDLRSNESGLRRRVRELLAKQKLIRLKLLSSEDRLRRAIRGFEALGEKGGSAIPELEKLLPLHAGYAPGALAGIGPTAMPAITNALCHTNPYVRWNMAVYLANAVYRDDISRDQAQVAVPLLVNNLADPSANGRIHAVAGLTAIARMPELAVPRLAELLVDSSPAVRSETAKALSSYGPEAKAAASALSKLLADADPAVTSAASEALSKIDPATSAMPLLETSIGLLKDPQEIIRMKAVQALGRITNVADRVVPELVGALLNDPSYIVRYSAAAALGDLKKEPDATIAALIKGMDDPSEFVRLEAARALGKFETNAKPALSILLEAGKTDTSEDVRINARSAAWFIDRRVAREAGF